MSLDGFSGLEVKRSLNFITHSSSPLRTPILMAKQVIFDTLCSVCERMIDEQHLEPPNHQWEFTHHSFENLEHSAQEGCHLCNLVLDQLDLERWSKFFRTPEIALQSKRHPLTFSIYRKDYHDPFKLRSEADTLAIMSTESLEINVSAPKISIPNEVAPCIAILSAQFRENTGEVVWYAQDVLG